MADKTDEAWLNEGDDGDLLDDPDAVLDAITRRAGAEQEKEFVPVTVESLKVVRGEDGKVTPLEVYTPMEGNPIRMLPLTVRDRITYRMKVNDRSSVTEYPLELKYKLITNHIIDPDFSGLTKKDMVDGFGYTTIDDLAAAVLMYSRDLFRQPLVKIQAQAGKAREEETEES